EPFKSLDEAIGGISNLAAKEEFTGKKDQSLSIPTLGKLSAGRILLLGLGEQGGFSHADARAFAAKAARAANGEKAKTLALVLPPGVDSKMRSIGEGLELGAYRFSKYLTGDRRPKASLESVTVGVSRAQPNAKKQIAIGQAVASGVNLSRDLSNEPANILTPA